MQYNLPTKEKYEAVSLYPPPTKLKVGSFDVSYAFVVICLCCGYLLQAVRGKLRMDTQSCSIAFLLVTIFGLKVTFWFPCNAKHE